MLTNLKLFEIHWLELFQNPQTLANLKSTNSLTKFLACEEYYCKSFITNERISSINQNKTCIKSNNFFNFNLQLIF